MIFTDAFKIYLDNYFTLYLKALFDLKPGTSLFKLKPGTSLFNLKLETSLFNPKPETSLFNLNQKLHNVPFQLDFRILSPLC